MLVLVFFSIFVYLTEQRLIKHTQKCTEGSHYVDPDRPGDLKGIVGRSGRLSILTVFFFKQQSLFKKSNYKSQEIRPDNYIYIFFLIHPENDIRTFSATRITALGHSTSLITAQLSQV